MEARLRQIVISVQLGMTAFFFIAALIAFLFLRNGESWILDNVWWILFIVGFADLIALIFLMKRYRQDGSDLSSKDPHG